MKSLCTTVLQLLLIILIRMEGCSCTANKSAAREWVIGNFAELRQLTNMDINKILHYHNVYRNFIASGSEKRGSAGPQPPAENMRQLVWSNKARTMSSTLAKKCIFEHEEHTTLVEETVDGQKEIVRRKFGQNLAFVASKKQLTMDQFIEESLDGMMGGWYQEVANWTYGEPWYPNTGHYRQMIWARTYIIGCSISLCTGGGKYVSNLYLVCDYYPRGNKEGEDPYIIGRVNCEKYNLRRSRSYPFLCAKFQENLEVQQRSSANNNNIKCITLIGLFYLFLSSISLF